MAITPSDPAKPSLRVDPLRLQAGLFATLQQLLDVLAVSNSGLPEVSEDAYASLPSLFFNVFPAQANRLSLSAARFEASVWLLRTAFREALEATGLYLDGCRTVAAICREADSGTLTVGVYQRIIGPEAEAFHKMGVPAKVQQLQDRFGIVNELSKYLLSINRVRNCLVHRLGIVTERDADQGDQLCLKVRALELYAPDPKGGPDVIVERSGVILPGGAPLMLRARELTRVFEKGQRVELSYAETLQAFLSIMQFAAVMTGVLQSRLMAIDRPRSDKEEPSQ